MAADPLGAGSLKPDSGLMHYNIKVLFPAIKEQMPGLTTIYMSTDGAPTQYMHADIYYYYFISRCKVQHAAFGSPGSSAAPRTAKT